MSKMDTIIAIMLRIIPIIDKKRPAFDHLFLNILFCFIAKTNDVTPKTIPTADAKIILKIPRTTEVTPQLLSFASFAIL